MEHHRRYDLQLNAILSTAPAILSFMLSRAAVFKVERGKGLFDHIKTFHA